MKANNTIHSHLASPELLEREWVPFPGGELEGKRPKVLCEGCKRRLELSCGHLTSAAARPQAVCFQCYRAEVERERALRRAGELHTASEARFQCTLPFEPVNRVRLAHLREERSKARASARAAAGLFGERRRRAQIAARHATERAKSVTGLPDRAAAFARVARAAELQLPESWLPYVVGGTE